MQQVIDSMNGKSFRLLHEWQYHYRVFTKTYLFYIEAQKGEIYGNVD